MGAACGKNADQAATIGRPQSLDPERASTRRSLTTGAQGSPRGKRGSHSMRASAIKGAGSAAQMRGKQSSNLTARASEDVEWSASEHSFVSNTTAPALYGTGNTVVRLTEDNLLRYERMYQYRSGQNNAIKKQLFQRLLEDSIRFSQMDPEPIPEEYLNGRRERSSSRSDRSQKTSASGSASTIVVDGRDASPSGTQKSGSQLQRTRSGRSARPGSPTGKPERISEGEAPADVAAGIPRKRTLQPTEADPGGHVYNI